MHKFFLISVSIICALILSSCGKKEDSKPVEKPQETTAKTARKKADNPVAPTQKAGTQQIQATSSVVAAPKLESLGTAPDFTLTTLDGEKVSLSGLTGKVVLIDFWATWCPPCRKMIPALNDLYTKYKRQGLEIIGISLDEGSPDSVKTFTENMRMQYLVAIGDHSISESYGRINAIPTTFIIDTQGVIRKKHVGFIDLEELEQSIKQLFAEKN